MTNTSATGGYLAPNPPPSPQPLEDAALIDFFQQVIVNLTDLDPTLVRPRWQVNPPNQPANNVTWAAIGVIRSPKDTYPFIGHQSVYTGILLGASLDDSQKDPGQWTSIVDGSFAIAVNGGIAVNVTGLNFSTIATMQDVARLITNQLAAQALGCICGWSGLQFVIISQSDGTASAVAPLTAAGVGTDLGPMMNLTAGSMQESTSGYVTDDVMQRHQELDILCSFYGPSADSAAARVSDGLAISQNRETLQTAQMALIEVNDPIAMPVKINNLWYYRVDQLLRVRRVITRSYPILNIQSAGGFIRTADVTTNFNA